MSSYDAVFAATRVSLGNPDISGTIRSVASEAFDISWIKARAQEALTAIENDLRRPFVLLRPRMFIDGDKWCALFGENIMEGVAGFGDTPDTASVDFDKNWNQQKAHTEGAAP